MSADPIMEGQRQNKRRAKMVFAGVAVLLTLFLVKLFLPNGDEATGPAPGTAIAADSGQGRGDGTNTGIGFDTMTIVDAALGGNLDRDLVPYQEDTPNPYTTTPGSAGGYGVDNGTSTFGDLGPGGLPANGGLLGQSGATNDTLEENAALLLAENQALRDSIDRVAGQQLREMRADSMRAARAAAEAARLEKLRGVTVTLYKGDAQGQSAIGPLPGEGGDGASGDLGNIDPSLLRYDTHARAEMMSTYNSAYPGAGPVQARLTSPLRVDGKTVLPAGTIAQGQATGSIGGAGVPARVQMNFTRFTLPNGRVVTGLNGMAGDPRTLTVSVAARTNNRYNQRLALLGLSTGSAALVATLNPDNRGVTCSLTGCVEQRSALTTVLDNAGNSLQQIFLGNQADPNDVPVEVVLERGTEFIILFGL
jgi:hypothetical protein